MSVFLNQAVFRFLFVFGEDLLLWSAGYDRMYRTGCNRYPAQRWLFLLVKLA